MNFLLHQFNQFRLVILVTTAMAGIYVYNTNLILIGPVILFSAFLISCINIYECLKNKSTTRLIILLHLFAAGLAVWGFIYSLNIVLHSNTIVEYGRLLH